MDVSSTGNDISIKVRGVLTADDGKWDVHRNVVGIEFVTLDTQEFVEVNIPNKHKINKIIIPSSKRVREESGEHGLVSENVVKIISDTIREVPDDGFDGSFLGSRKASSGPTAHVRRHQVPANIKVNVDIGTEVRGAIRNVRDQREETSNCGGKEGDYSPDHSEGLKYSFHAHAEDDEEEDAGTDHINDRHRNRPELIGTYNLNKEREEMGDDGDDRRGDVAGDGDDGNGKFRKRGKEVDGFVDGSEHDDDGF